MLVVVTGAAGFIGSHLTEHLLARGDQVRGIDSLTNYYDPSLKRANLKGLLRSANFSFHEIDLATSEIVQVIDGAEAIFHQAGQPGVRSSWADGFGEYCDQNVIATQRLLEASLRVGVKRIIYASSSSVYGNSISYPVSESNLPQPQSPYGVTKLAAEHLCSLYASNYGLPTVSLRYFTVYGPRQRPDMAFRRLINSALTGDSFPLFGSGHQIRDFTYVDDVVRANLLSCELDVMPGTVVNIAGGTRVEMLEVIDRVEQLTGRRVSLDRRPRQAGDVERTEASIEAATSLLGWRPEVQLSDGLKIMVDWARNLE